MPLFGPPNVDKLKAKNNVKGLIKALGYEKDQHVREAAAGALSQIGDPQAVEPLIAALKDKNVRQAAASALVQIGAPAVEPLIAALMDENSSLRWIAARALGQIGDGRAVEPLIAALKDVELVVRGASIEALGKIGDARAVKPLSNIVKNWSRMRFAEKGLWEKAASALETITGQNLDTERQEALRHFERVARREARSGAEAYGKAYSEWKREHPNAGASELL